MIDYTAMYLCREPELPLWTPMVPWPIRMVSRAKLLEAYPVAKPRESIRQISQAQWESLKVD